MLRKNLILVHYCLLNYSKCFLIVGTLSRKVYIKIKVRKWNKNEKEKEQ